MESYKKATVRHKRLYELVTRDGLSNRCNGCGVQNAYNEISRHTRLHFLAGMAVYPIAFVRVVMFIEIDSQIRIYEWDSSVTYDEDKNIEL
jgi:hypothetical protein